MNENTSLALKQTCDPWFLGRHPDELECAYLTKSSILTLSPEAADQKGQLYQPVYMGTDREKRNQMIVERKNHHWKYHFDLWLLSHASTVCSLLSGVD